MKRGLQDPPPLHMQWLIACQKAIADQFPQERGTRVTNEPVLLCNQDLPDDFRIVNEADSLTQDLEHRHGSVLFSRTFQKGEGFCRGAATQKPISFQSARSGGKVRRHKGPASLP